MISAITSMEKVFAQADTTNEKTPHELKMEDTLKPFDRYTLHAYI